MQDKSNQLSRLMEEYSQRKSKVIKYTPTEKELRAAMRLYMVITDSAKENDPNGLKLVELLNSVSKETETQIKFTGFMDEILKKFPDGKIPHQDIMNAAEKWDVLEYVVEDIIKVLNIKMDK